MEGIKNEENSQLLSIKDLKNRTEKDSSTSTTLDNSVPMEKSLLKETKFSSNPVVSVTDTSIFDEQKESNINFGFNRRHKDTIEKDIFTVKMVGKKNLEPLPTIQSYLERADRKSWGYKSVLFWKQDSLSIASSSDTEDVYSLNDFKDECSNPEYTDVSTNNNEVDELIKEVEELQKKFIDPLLPADDEIVSDDSDTTGSPVYLCEFPENSIESYSPIYNGISQCLDKILEMYDRDVNMIQSSPSDQTVSDIKIEENLILEDKIDNSMQCSDPGVILPTLNFVRSSQLEELEELTDFDLSDAKTTISAFINSERCKQNTEGDLINVDVVDGIKMVQQTLQEISMEINNVRRSKSFNDKKDPNIILRDLLAEIRPPRDSRSSFPKLRKFSELGRIDSIDSHVDTASRDTNMETEVSELPLNASLDTALEILTGDPLKDEIFYQPDVSLGEVHPAGRLNHVYENLEELKHVVCEDMDSNVTNEQLPSIEKGDRSVISNLAVSNPLEVDVSPQISPSYERRGSAWSTTTGAMNYDSGFSEFPRSSIDKQDQALTSPEALSDQITFQQNYPSMREDIESETSTDWSPNSTLSREQSLKKTKHRSGRCRNSPKRRSNPTNSNNKASNVIVPTASCPNFSQYLNLGNNSATMYSKAELDAIRKFLALTSQYFSTKVDEEDDKNGGNQDESEDISVIRQTIRKQRQDLEKQRQQQEELLRQIGDMLLEIVTLKEDHMSVRQRQAKALTILKKQLDHYKREQEKAQKDIKEQVKQLGDKLNSQMSLLQERTLSACPSSLDRLSVSTCQDPLARGEIVWKITNFAKKVAKVHAGQSDGIVISEHFYSQTYGYKMSAWLYLNGRGEYRGKGMSVYVCILVGEYDAILNWPVRPRYRFALIDQNASVDNRRDHVKVRCVVDIANRGENAIAKHGGIPRPQQGAKSLIVGFDDFISQKELNTRNYVLDDTIFFKISADSFL